MCQHVKTCQSSAATWYSTMPVRQLPRDETRDRDCSTIESVLYTFPCRLGIVMLWSRWLIFRRDVRVCFVFILFVFYGKFIIDRLFCQCTANTDLTLYCMVDRWDWLRYGLYEVSSHLWMDEWKMTVKSCQSHVKLPIIIAVDETRHPHLTCSSYHLIPSLIISHITNIHCCTLCISHQARRSRVLTLLPLVLLLLPSVSLGPSVRPYSIPYHQRLRVRTVIYNSQSQVE